MLTEKQLYTVKLEVIAPIELTYKVWAETPQQAVELINTGQMTAQPKPTLSRKRNIKATVYRYGYQMIEFVKKYI